MYSNIILCFSITANLYLHRKSWVPDNASCLWLQYSSVVFKFQPVIRQDLYPPSWLTEVTKFRKWTSGTKMVVLFRLIFGFLDIHEMTQHKTVYISWHLTPMDGLFTMSAEIATTSLFVRSLNVVGIHGNSYSASCPIPYGKYLVYRDIYLLNTKLKYSINEITNSTVMKIITICYIF